MLFKHIFVTYIVLLDTSGTRWIDKRTGNSFHLNSQGYCNQCYS